MKKSKRRMLTVLAILLTAALTLSSCSSNVQDAVATPEPTPVPTVFVDYEGNYNQGRALLAENRLDEAAEIFAETNDFGATQQYLAYIEAAKLERAGDYAAAADAFAAAQKAKRDAAKAAANAEPAAEADSTEEVEA